MLPWAISRQVRVGMLTPRRLAIRRAVSSRRAMRSRLCLSPYPAEHLLVLHQRFLTETARYVQHVELRRVGESCIGHELEPVHISHRASRFGEDAVSRIRKAAKTSNGPVRSI